MSELQEQLKLEWKSKFDHIWCIHFLPYHETRYPRVSKELERVGILDSGIFSWKNTFQSAFYEVLRKNVKHRHQSTAERQGAFNCSLAHYEIYKEALGLDYSRILVIEEDATFLKDLDLLRQTIHELPESNVVLLDHICNNPYGFRPESRDQSLQIGRFYRAFNSNCYWYGSTACYSIDNHAMKLFVEEQEKCVECADELWNNYGNQRLNEGFTRAFAMPNVAIQKPFDEHIHPDSDFIRAYQLAEVDTRNY